MTGGEYGFLTDDAPSAQESDRPSNLGLVAEDILDGLRLAISTLNRSASHEMGSRRRLEVATYKLLKWLDDIPKTGCRPFIEVQQPLEGYRLGCLLNGQYALYEPAMLIPSRNYPVNYVYDHNPPQDHEMADILPGLEYQKQIYLGYAPPTIHDMDGYAISLNQLLVLEERQAACLDAEPAPDIQLPYYRGFPDLGATRPKELR